MMLVSIESWNMLARIGAISFDSSFRTRGLMLSGPAALKELSELRSFSIPTVDIVISGADGD
ncbi:hypothetical protein DPMN_036240 [Dreissena polymorpha]|uniref:Uncharacterized protein n=1 Tax=Dreissena polymorpha TaxID=45954 RepID=A0A9D4RNP8_DREPO|nr:hypothetical protein DPMN_036240 [Dreissena polymorpha]